MLQGSKGKSYGAREEMRGSGMAIRQVMKDAGATVSQPSLRFSIDPLSDFLLAQMNTYLEEFPLLCVRSADFFEFQERRMLELSNVQFHMAKHRSENYGTVTSLLMHLMRLVDHSPIPMAPYLRDALMDSHYDQVVERFGMFFLHELDLEHGTIGGIDKEDSPECKFAMSKTALASKRPISKKLFANTDPTAQFPLGNAPTWTDIVHILHHEPIKLMREWIWDPNWDYDPVVSGLFVNFTTHYWLTIQKRALFWGASHSKELGRGNGSLDSAISGGEPKPRHIPGFKPPAERQISWQGPPRISALDGCVLPCTGSSHSS